jgi:hypothetical protein
MNLLLNKFDLISDLLVTNQSGFPFSELVLKPSNPDGFSDLYSFLLARQIQVRLNASSISIEIPEEQFSWKPQKGLTTDQAALLASQRHPKILIFFVTEIFQSRYKSVIPGVDGKIKPLLAELIKVS